MRSLALTLIILGLIIPVAAIVRAWLMARKRADELEQRIEQAKRAKDEEERDKILRPSSTWADVMFMREIAQSYVVRSEAQQLIQPAVFTFIGLLLSTIGSVIALFIT